MTLYSGTASAIMSYTVEADDKEQAIDFIFDMIKEDMPDADAYDVGGVEALG